MTHGCSDLCLSLCSSYYNRAVFITLHKLLFWGGGGETGSHEVAQAGLQLDSVLLPQPPEAGMMGAHHHTQFMNSELSLLLIFSTSSFFNSWKVGFVASGSNKCPQLGSCHLRS